MANGAKDAKVKQGVGIAHSVRHQEDPTVEQYGPHFRLCLTHSLRQNSGGNYTRAIRGRKLILREKKNNLNGQTFLDLRDKEAAKLPGNNPLKVVLSNWGRTIAEETIKHAASSVNPIFKILLSAVFATETPIRDVKIGNGEAEFYDKPTYIPFEKTAKEPGTEVFNLEAGFFESSGDGATTGKVTYELESEATIKKQQLAGTGPVIGTVSQTTEFDVNWTSNS